MQFIFILVKNGIGSTFRMFWILTISFAFVFHSLFKKFSFLQQNVKSRPEIASGISSLLATESIPMGHDRIGRPKGVTGNQLEKTGTSSLGTGL